MESACVRLTHWLAILVATAPSALVALSASQGVLVRDKPSYRGEITLVPWDTSGFGYDLAGSDRRCDPYFILTENDTKPGEKSVVYQYKGDALPVTEVVPLAQVETRINDLREAPTVELFDLRTPAKMRVIIRISPRGYEEAKGCLPAPRPTS